MYEKVEPTSIAIMKKKRYHGHNTICEKLREIFMLADNEEIKIKCRLAMTMAKKMHNKLKEYRNSKEFIMINKIEENVKDLDCEYPAVNFEERKKINEIIEEINKLITAINGIAMLHTKFR